MGLELRKGCKYALVVPTSMGIRLTPENGQPLHCCDRLKMQATSAESNVASVSSFLGLPVKVLTTFVNDEFLAALPALRLAFTFFTPREKHHMGMTLLESLGLRDLQPLASLEVTPQQAAEALRFESRVFAEAARYGLRGGAHE